MFLSISVYFYKVGDIFGNVKHNFEIILLLCSALDGFLYVGASSRININFRSVFHVLNFAKKIFDKFQI